MTDNTLLMFVIQILVAMIIITALKFATIPTTCASKFCKLLIQFIACTAFSAYFTRGDYNIIIVDYSTIVKEPCLSQINWAPRFGAKCIAQLVDYLSKHPRGVPPDALHLIGYSVGAHIAGLVANYLNKGKLGRITGENVHTLHQGVQGRTDMYWVERRDNKIFGHNIRFMNVESKNDHSRQPLINGEDKVYVSNHYSIQMGMETTLRPGQMRNCGQIHTRRNCSLI